MLWEDSLPVTLKHDLEQALEIGESGEIVDSAWECQKCHNEFVVAGVPRFCPYCGTEFKEEA